MSNLPEEKVINLDEELLPILAHEMRQPLHVLQTGLDLLSAKGTEPQDIVTLLRQQVVDLEQLVQNLLGTSRARHSGMEQGKRTLDRSEGGHGIGLALVRHIVELHDGSVAVRSEGVGQGSEFLVQLPTNSCGS